MVITREELNPCTLKLQITCTPEEVQRGFDKALKDVAKTMKLPGFRPGHAPKAMVAKMVSREDIKQEAAEEIVNTTYRKALEQEKIGVDQSTRSGFTLDKFEGDELIYTVKVPLPPKIELSDYKGIPLSKPKVVVTDEEVQQQIDDLRRARQTRESVTDRGAIEGDIALVNIKLDGVEGDGKTFMTVVGQTFPDLDGALVGMKVEEMKHLELSFPGTFQEKEWANTTATCQVTLNSMTAVKLPELDDDFAQLYKIESADRLKEILVGGIHRAKEDMLREVMFDGALEHLQKASTIHVSDNMWENLAMRRLEETAEEQQKKGKNLEQYAAENGMTLEDLVKAWQDKAKLHVERALVIREVFTKEDMKLTNVDLSAELREMAVEYGMEPEDLLKTLQKNQAMEELQFRAISRKVADFLIANAKLTEVAPDAAPVETPAEETAPAKPKKTKKS